MKYAFIEQQTGQHRVSILCKTLSVSRSGYYAWRKRPASTRALANQSLLSEIWEVHQRSRENYGADKAWQALNDNGVACGRHRVARLRRENNIYAKRRRRFVVTTRSKNSKWLAPNLLKRQFTVEQPNRVWVGDVTFIPTKEGWLYLAVLLDLHSRCVVGWSMSNRNNTALVLSALTMAIQARRPTKGLIHHSDQGQTYAAGSYRQELEAHGMTPSMSRKGNCWDNAVAESFFATLEFELIDRQVYATRNQAKSAIFEFIEVFYNRQRIHETLGYKTPVAVDEAAPLVA